MHARRERAPGSRGVQRWLRVLAWRERIAWGETAFEGLFSAVQVTKIRRYRIRNYIWRPGYESR